MKQGKSRSFGLVDYKVAEADFFLKRICQCGPDFFAVRCYVSAFISSARSVTYTLQSVMNRVDGFHKWYTKEQEELKKDRLAVFFNRFRRINQHIGENPVTAGQFEKDIPSLFFFRKSGELKNVPEEDVALACKKYLTRIIQLVYDCYLEFGPYIDAHRYYTAENFSKINKTIEDADEEVFGARGWSSVPGMPIEYRWQFIRDNVIGCEIQHIFQEYLGKTVPVPARLPEPSEQKGK